MVQRGWEAYAPQLGAQLHITHTQLNIIGLAGNMGVYLTAPFIGRLVDRKGPRPLLIMGFFLLFVGYTGIRHYFDAAAPLSTLQLCILVMFSFFTGAGGSAGLTAAINTTAKSFPDLMRATTTSLVAAGFGLSAFFFSSISHALFPGNASNFLLLLSIGTSLPLILGLFTVRVVPHPETAIPEQHPPRRSLEAGLLEEEGERRQSESWESHTAVAAGGVYAHLSDSETEEEESRAACGTGNGGGQIEQYPLGLSPSRARNLQLSPQRSHQTTTPSGRSRSRTRSHTRKSHHQHEHVDIHGWGLLRAGDFWILVGIMACLSGTGLMYINNVGSISQALFATGNPDFDTVLSAQWQATQVSLLSIANCLGRIALGSAADFGKHHWGWHRPYWMSVISIIFILSQIFVFTVKDVASLWLASVALGFGYGGMYGLFPTIMIEGFGLVHFSQNWGFLSLSPVLAGNLFSLVFGRNLDAHTPTRTNVHHELDHQPRGGLPSTDARHQCLEGRICYAESAKLTIIACIVALSLSIVAAIRVRRKKAQHQRPEREETEVLWEGGNE